MVEDILNQVLMMFGTVMIVVGAVADLIASVGLLRFPNFFVRLHAATVGTIWGAFVPLVGVALFAAGYTDLGQYRWFVAGGSAVTASLILLLGPVGSHALARAAYKSRAAVPQPIIHDALGEKLKEDEEK
ncbi:MAG: monovalent cation/H(+) antiporter subunit G [Zestosphaera sp.]